MKEAQSTVKRTQPSPAEECNVVRRAAPRLDAQAVLAILREQSIPESEARRRVRSDPELGHELDD